MFAFELDKVVATLEHVTMRTEKRGDEDVPALTLKISAALGADILAHFTPEMRAHLFTTKSDLAGEVLAVRDPHMVFPMKRDEEMFGAVAAIAYGVGEPMTFSECVVDDFSLTPMEGGTVITKFNIGVVGHDHHIEKLYKMQKQGIELSIEPPELQEMRDAA